MTWTMHNLCSGLGYSNSYRGTNRLLLLREALFPSGSEEKLMSSCLVTRIIDFCERHREGVTRLLDLVGLSLGF